MSLTPEETFYSSEILTEFAIPTHETIQLFKPGKRYGIIAESLSQEIMPIRNMVVELGCFKGDRLIHVKDQFGFSKAVGIDLCFRDSISSPKGYQFYSANLNQAWPIDAGTADALIAMMLLEHLFDPYASFREIKRCLSPSGRAFVNLPLVTSVKNRMRLLFGKIPITSVPYQRWHAEGHWDGFHLHYFTIAAIRDLAFFSGLKINRVRGIGRLSGVKSLVPSLFCDEVSFELRHA